MDEDWDDGPPQHAMNDNVDSHPAIVGRSFGGRGRGFAPAENKFGGGGGFKKDNDGDKFGGRRSFGDENGSRGGGRGRRFGDNDDSRGGGGGRRNFGDENDSRGGRRNFGDENDSRGGGGGRRNFNDENDSRGGGGGRRNFGDENGTENGRRRNFGNDNETRGGGGGRKNFDDDELNGDGEAKPKAQTYIPPEPTDDESELYGSGISSGINFSKYDDIPVKVSGDEVPQSVDSFKDAGLRPFLLDLVKKCGYQVPTPIQKYALPCIMSGRDVMACAQTGSGKTAAFLLPIIHNLLANHESSAVDGNCVAPQAIIVAPTRELTNQIWSESRKFIRGSGLQTCNIYGGTQVYHQIEQLMKGANIVVATPGRLNDFVGRGKIVFDKIRFVVLDEADRMLDMGFKTDIDKVMSHPSMVPKTERQTLMFSATFPESIQRMAGQFLNKYLFIAVGQVGGACSDVEQRILQVSRSEKRDKLLELLSEYGGDKTVVFVETKRQADYISVVLSERKLPATSIHGDREQRQREEAISDFKRGRMAILVATAVASRGLDIKDVRHVINYDMPKEIDEYVHRIGRTGRLGNRGLATSFYDPEKDSELAPALVRILAQACQEVPDFLQSNGYGYGGSSGNFGGNDFRSMDTPAPAAQEAIDGEEW